MVIGVNGVPSVLPYGRRGGGGTMVSGSRSYGIFVDAQLTVAPSEPCCRSQLSATEDGRRWKSISGDDTHCTVHSSARSRKATMSSNPYAPPKANVEQQSNAFEVPHDVLGKIKAATIAGIISGCITLLFTSIVVFRGDTTSFTGACIILYYYLRGAQGTFAYHKLRQQHLRQMSV